MSIKTDEKIVTGFSFGNTAIVLTEHSAYRYAEGFWVGMEFIPPLPRTTTFAYPPETK